MTPDCGLLGGWVSFSSGLRDQERSVCVYQHEKSHLWSSEILHFFFVTSGEVNKAKAPWRLPVFLLLGKYHPIFTVVRLSGVWTRKRHSSAQHSKATQSHGRSGVNDSMNLCLTAALKKSPPPCCGSGRPSGWRCSTAGTSSCWKSTKRFVTQFPEKSSRSPFAFSKTSFDTVSLPSVTGRWKSAARRGSLRPCGAEPGSTSPEPK